MDTELVLDLSFGLSSALNDDTHFFNGVHLGLLGDEDPVIELLVKGNGLFTVPTQVGQGPVADLDESEAEDRLLSLNGFLHLLNVGALLYDGFSIVVFGGGALLRVSLLGSSLLGVNGGLELSNIGYDLLLKSHSKELIKSGEGVGAEISLVGILSDRLEGWVLALGEGELDELSRSGFRDQFLFNVVVVVLNDLNADFKFVQLALHQLLGAGG